MFIYVYLSTTVILETTENPNEDVLWYIVKQTNGTCEIVISADSPPAETIWGPFPSQSEAIAKRVGLIRAGLCQPQ